MSYSAKCRIDQKSYATNCRIGEMVFDELSCTHFLVCNLPSITVNQIKKSTLGTKVLHGLESYYDWNFRHFGIQINYKIDKHLFILFIYFSKSIKKSTLNFKV